MSAALFNAHADPSKARAISAGTSPSTTGLHPVCVTVMQVQCSAPPMPHAQLEALDIPCLGTCEESPERFCIKMCLTVHDFLKLNCVSFCVCRSWASTSLTHRSRS